MPSTRWGILGTGAIAHKFATGLQALEDAELVAVGSRAQETADRFGEEFAIPRRHASYQALADDTGVDAIYVATPHPMHCENTLMCLRAGKAVLCEKPFAINAREAAEMVQVARGQDRFLMEAMWTRFLPVHVRVREWLAAGAIGEPRMVAADFGFRAGFNPEGRLFKPALGGGGLLDVGVYTISYASMVFGGGVPEQITGVAALGETGVDEQAAFSLRYPGGKLASLTCAVRTNTPQEARILGTEGSIRIDPFWCGTTATLSAGGQQETFERPHLGNGYEYEAQEVMRCLREGKLESDIMPLDETLTIMRTMDELRALWSVRYPME